MRSAWPKFENRMFVPPGRYDDWQQAGAGQSGEFLKPWPSQEMAAAIDGSASLNRS
jgi:hypothetical protein